MKNVKPPKFIQKFTKKLIWNIPNDNNTVFFTFDDCSDEDLTLWCLDILDYYGIKATFFCTGRYIEINRLDKFLISRGHSVANHGYLHLNGFKTDVHTYINNVLQSSSLIDSNLFRPPYGKIKPVQIKKLSYNFKIVLWTVLSYDFDPDVLPNECLYNVKKNTKSGDIIVFHPIYKARKNIMYALPASIEFMLKNGYSFGKIDDFV